ncbi:hypothetical protein [Accumulibacter sp.]|uniref:hypothetical protein n=1 Tax=Accumulibacter sp. TaxID=2053492 RepID=UPI0025DA6002|nr:hypothetical protein [Accumulibacter sp.]MCM8612750.1 SAM-dependent methyltransferase [Accumulibacter sp.]MCM8637656.1 SAM-dependent methyltransferase [Accumulibacter sp.]MCM8639683.1 SAM-dependent methyltransferase [Accumulibacter sp.]
MIERLAIPAPVRHSSIYDPACGTGGILSVANERSVNRMAGSSGVAQQESTHA